MILFRSALFNVLFFLNIMVWMVICLPVMAMPRRVAVRTAQGWCRSALWLARTVAGLTVQVRGRERIPQGGLLVASKHQSFLETFALLVVFDDPTFILKRELMWIPVFGWYLAKLGMVPIDRRAGAATLADMTRRARQRVGQGRQLIIFPEGTRRPPGAPPAYKHGVAHLYESLRAPCLPVALNTGLFWPRRGFAKRPGVASIEIGEPIAAGAQRNAFLADLRARVETASDRLLAEGRASLGAELDATADGGLQQAGPLASRSRTRR